jgi:ribosome-associated translation inhibitor RaiA
VIRHKIRSLWNSLLNRNDEFMVEISGLEKGDQAYKESLVEESNKALHKINHILNDVQGINIRVKSGLKDGRKQHYELHALLKTNGFEVSSKAEGFDLYTALQKLFYELENVAKKESGKRKEKGGKRER